MADESARLDVIDLAPGHVALRGEVDAHSAALLTAAFDPWPNGVAQIRIDMGEVTFMDSSGLRALIELQQRADESDVQLVVVSPSRSVARLIEISGLEDTIDVAST